MIFPDEYKYVGISRAIPEDAEDRRIYFLTKYLIVEDTVDGEVSYSLYSVKNTGEHLL